MKEERVINIYKAGAFTPGGYIGVVDEFRNTFTVIVGDSKAELLEAFLHGGRFTIPGDGFARIISGDIRKPCDFLRIPVASSPSA